jgi:hypothetical protein
MGVDLISQRKTAIQQCIAQFNISNNPSIDDALLNFHGVPLKSSSLLAALILTFKREALHTELRKISDQPAALINRLHTLGFKFKTEQNNEKRLLYKNRDGEVCRMIIGFEVQHREAQGHAKELLQKSIHACLSAIEIYNKPDFKYREETFSILMINAWELLFKAKLLHDNGNKAKAIYDGTKNNRTGNPKTIDINESMRKLGEHNVPKDLRLNLAGLIEIRDNAVHFMNKGAMFCVKVQEFGTASLRNYLILLQKWFNYDLSKYNFFLMPLSFYTPQIMSPIALSKSSQEMKKVIEFLAYLENESSTNSENNMNVSMKLSTKFVRSSSESNLLVQYSNDPDAIRIKTTVEDDLARRYPMSFTDLRMKLKERYKGLKFNQEFNAFKRELEDPEKNGVRYCTIRLLNPKNEKSSKMKFYSTEIFKEFDNHYKVINKNED